MKNRKNKKVKGSLKQKSTTIDGSTSCCKISDNELSDFSELETEEHVTSDSSDASGLSDQESQDERTIRGLMKSHDFSENWNNNIDNYYESAVDSADSDDEALELKLEEAMAIRQNYLKTAMTVAVADLQMDDQQDLDEGNSFTNLDTNLIELQGLLKKFSSLKDEENVNAARIDDDKLTSLTNDFRTCVECFNRDFVNVLSCADSGKIILTDKGLSVILFHLLLAVWSMKVLIAIKFCAPELISLQMYELNRAIAKSKSLRRKYIGQDNLDSLVCLANDIIKKESAHLVDLNAVFTSEHSGSRGGSTSDHDALSSDEGFVGDSDISEAFDNGSGYFNDDDSNKELSEDVTSSEEAYNQLSKKKSELAEVKSIKQTVTKLSKLPMLPAKLDSLTEKRALNRAMEKNRGLTRKRKKYESNARVHNRMKYRMKLISHASKSLHGEKKTAGENYHGESSGISEHVTRGRRLKQ